MKRAAHGLGAWMGDLALAVLACAALAWPARAQSGTEGGTPAPEQLVQVTAAPVTLAAGGHATLTLRLAILAGWHVNANPPALDYNIPTTVSIASAHGISAGPVKYPAGKQQKFEFEETPMLVYDGAADVQGAGRAFRPRRAFPSHH